MSLEDVAACFVQFSSLPLCHAGAACDFGVWLERGAARDRAAREGAGISHQLSEGHSASISLALYGD